jgi:HlyD family secretion protein
VEPSGFTKVSALGIEEQRVNVVIDPAEGEAWPDSLGHAFRVVARIAVWHSARTLTVPMGALFRVGDRWAVLRVEDGVARLQEVTIGRMADLTAQVEDGLTDGDMVVLHPSDRVGDGTAVEARR